MGNHKTFLKQRYELIPEYVDRVDEYIQKITAEAYRNVNLISNQVLSRNPHTNKFFHNLLFQKDVPRPNVFQVFYRLVQYYSRSLVEFSFYLVTFLAQRVVGETGKKPTLDFQGDLYVIDTFVLQEGVLRNRCYEEQYFVGLDKILEKYDKHLVVLPRFYGALRNPSQVMRVIRLLNQSACNFVTEFQLLHISDLLRTFQFILRYPFDVLVLAHKTSNRELIDHLLIAELEATLDQVTLFSFIRFLVGRRFGELARARINLISWTENQVIDKNFYRGVKETARDVFVYGCQPFVAYPALVNIRTAEAEKKLNVTPDHVLVNGPAYLRENTRIVHRLGPSFRYGWIFSTPVDWDRKTDAVIFLCYFDELNREIISACIGATVLQEQAVAVRPHPASSVKRLPKLPQGWHYSDKSKIDLIGSAAILITSESGAAVEAAALGSSVIIVASQSTFTSNPMLETGRGKIWELVFDASELDLAYQQLCEYRERNIASIKELADFYKRACFVEPTEENIVQAFDLLASRKERDK